MFGCPASIRDGAVCDGKYSIEEAGAGTAVHVVTRGISDARTGLKFTTDTSHAGRSSLDPGRPAQVHTWSSAGTWPPFAIQAGISRAPGRHPLLEIALGRRMRDIGIKNRREGGGALWRVPETHAGCEATTKGQSTPSGDLEIAANPNTCPNPCIKASVRTASARSRMGDFYPTTSMDHVLR